MKALAAFVSAAVLAAALTTSAAPANAAVFAQFAPDSGRMDYRWIRSAAGTGGHFFSISPSNQNATTAQNVATHFSFLDPSLGLLAFIPATFSIDATVANGNPASMNGAGVWTQTALNGSFSFTYTGPTITNYNGSGITLVHNSNLLSGVFTDAWIQGAGGSGSTNVANGNGGSATYTSDYENFVDTANDEFAFNLLAVTPAFGAAPNKALNGFRANGGGNFSFEAVPEPAAWALMIAGFGGVGAALRRRRAVITAA